METSEGKWLVLCCSAILCIDDLLLFFSPITLFWSCVTSDEDEEVFYNIVMFVCTV